MPWLIIILVAYFFGIEPFIWVLAAFTSIRIILEMIVGAENKHH